MKSHSPRNLPVHSISLKVIPLAAIAFFLSADRAAAANNVSSGDVYGQNYNSASIVSVEDGTNNLTILNNNTTSLTISHDVVGFVTVSNDFDAFSIDASGGSVTTSLSNNTSALSVYSGGTLTVSEGTFSGGSLEIGTNAWAEAAGGFFSNLQTAMVSDVTFEGRSLVDESSSTDGPPIPGESTYVTNASGSAGLIISDSTYVQLNDSTVTGGDAGEATGYYADMTADGGIGLEVFSSTLVLSNVTVTGGDGGDADAYGDYSDHADGGDALYASGASVEIYEGTLTGGAGGTTNSGVTLGGSAVRAVNGSSVVIHSGTYKGGSDSPAVYLQNSDLTTYGGSFTTGGLSSRTDGSSTNRLNLMGGTFSSLKFVNAANGVQLVTASNITVSVEVFQQGGIVDVTNLEDDGFQFVTVSNGTMIFREDLTLASSSEFNLMTGSSRMEFKGALEIGEGAEFNINLGQVEAGDITVLEDAVISFNMVSTNAGLITSSGTVNFESNSTVSLNAIMADYSTGTTTTTVITATNIIYNGFKTDVAFSTNSAVTGRTSLAETITGTDNLSFVFTTLSFSNYWNASGQMAKLANEFEDLASDDLNLIINSLGASASAALVEQTYFSTLNTFQAAKQGLGASLGLGLSRGTDFREQLRLPAGPQGPESQNDWRFWLKYYGSFYSSDGEGLNTAYDTTLHGGALGMDKSFGRLLIGLSAGAGNYTIDADSTAEQSMDAFQAALYSTCGFGDAYLDLGLAYGFNQVESTTADPFALEGEFDAHLFSAHIGGGRSFDFPKIGAVLTPEASLQYTLYEQEAYTETGSIAVPREFDAFDSESLVASIGLNAAMLDNASLDYFAFKMEGRLHWMREFNPEPGELNYSLVGGANDYSIIYPYLDEDTIRLGVGFTFFNAQERALKNVLLRLDFDELFGDGFNSHNLSAKVIYAF